MTTIQQTNLTYETLGESDRSPLLSVIIPCYRQAHFIADAIWSILTQQHFDVAAVEIIVVDDGSPDDVQSAVCNIEVPPYTSLILIRQTNRGRSAARNIGLQLCRGQYVLFLDADDYLKEDSLALHAKYWCDYPDYDVYYGNKIAVATDGTLISHSDPQILAEFDPFHSLLFGYTIALHSITIRKSSIRDIYFDISLHGFEDWALMLELAYRNRRFIYVDGSAVYYRRYPYQTTRNPFFMHYSGIKVLDHAKSYHSNCEQCHEAIEHCHNYLNNDLRTGIKASVYEKIRLGDNREAIALAVKAFLLFPLSFPVDIFRALSKYRRRPAIPGVAK